MPGWLNDPSGSVPWVSSRLDGWMQRPLLAASLGLLLATCMTLSATAQTFTDKCLSYRSTGSGVGNWTLSDTGYVHYYFTLAAPGQVTHSVNASGSTSDATLHQMNIVVADT